MVEAQESPVRKQAIELDMPRSTWNLVFLSISQETPCKCRPILRHDDPVTK